MNAKGIIISLFSIFLLHMQSPLYAQRASAELISSHAPAKLSSGEMIKEGIQNVFYLNQRLYVVNIWSGLQILDVSDVKAPKELGAYTTEHRVFNVFVDDHFAYLSQKSGGVLLLDVSDPAHIKKVGRIKTKGEAYYVLAAYPTVYVAEEAQCIGIYDVQDASAVTETGRFKGKGWAWSLFLQDSILYVGAKNGGLGILDVSNPAAPKMLGSFNGVKFTKSIQIEDGIAYIAEGPGGLVLVDIRNPRKPRFLSHLKVKGWVDNAFKSGNSVFLSNDKERSLQIVDVSDLRNPIMSGAYKSKYKIYASLKKGVYVFVAADEQCLILRYNRPPVIEAIAAQTVDENQLLDVFPTASDPDNDAYYFTVENLPQNAVFDSVSGHLNWTPDFEQSGSYKNVKITVREKTESALSASASFDISVVHVNRLPELPPVPPAEVQENAPLTFTVAEGSDPDKEDAGKLVYSVTGLPVGAQFDSLARVFSWTPTYDQSGVYTLTFSITDPAGASAEQTTVVTVKHVDRKPVLAEVGNKTIQENEVLTVTLDGRDADKEDQSALSYKAEHLPQGAVFDAQTATFSWTPTYDQSGVYKDIRFVFTAGALSDSVSININVAHVNRPPQLNAISAQTVDENKLLSFAVSASDFDTEDSGKLTYSAEHLPQGAVFNADSAKFSWTPTFEQSGTYPDVLFIVNDPSGLSDSVAVEITVAHINRAPLLSALEAKTVDENTVLEFDLPGSDPDKEDEGKLVYSIDKLPEGAVLEGNHFKWMPSFDQSGVYPLQFTVSDGRLSDSKEMTITVNHVNRPPVLEAVAAQQVNENEALSFTVRGGDPDAEDNGKIKISAENLPQGALFDTTGNQFNWTPTFEQSGACTVRFVLTDAAGLTDAKEVQITVAHVNRSPEFPLQAAQTVDENQPLVYNLIPATDADKEDEGKLVYTVKDLPQGAVFDEKNLTLNWTPTFEQSGEYTVTLSVSDGAFTVEQPLLITVNHVNRPPVITPPEPQVVDENTPWNYTVVYSDPDKEDEGKLTISAENLPPDAVFDAAGATFSWTPTYDQSGVYEGISVTVSDPAGLSDQKDFTVTVNHVNRAPKLETVAAVTVKENEAVNFTLAASDADKEDTDKLTFGGTNLPQGAQLDAASGAFSWTPTFLQAGAYTVTFKVTDGAGLSAEQSTQITVTDVNHAPQLKAVDNASVKENEALTISVSAQDEDSDNKLTYSADGLPSGATFDAQRGVLTWTPGFDQAGDYSVTFKVSDGKEEAETAANITVENVNRAPQISGPASETAQTGESLRLSYSGSDADGDDLSFDASGLPSGASFNSGTFTWTPEDGQAGSYSISVSVSDGTDEAEMTTKIVVTEKPAPAPPDTSAH